MNTERNSSFELLRIISIYGIISMHTFAQYVNSAIGLERIYGCFINVYFNMGVTLFMLISGYFGIKYTKQKFINIIFTIITYSILNTAFSFIQKEYFSVSELIMSILCIFTNRYWYITTYILIFITSTYINKFIYTLTEIEFKKLIFILILFFIIAPSILGVQILNDTGKGIINMFIVYITGRYIKIYDYNISRNKALFSFILLSLLNFAITISISIYKLPDGGIINRFCYDNSIFIFLESLSFFLLMQRLEFYNRPVNQLAKTTLSAYLFEGTVRKIIYHIYMHQSVVNLGIITYNILIPFLVICFVFFIEKIRLTLSSKIEKKLSCKLN